MADRVKREIEVAGSAGPAELVRLLREMFVALSGGRHVPADLTRSESVAYYDRTDEYLTAEGDGLVARECLDYGEYHHRWSFGLTIGDAITVGVDENWREPTFVFYLSATAETVDAAADTLVRTATTVRLRVVAQR